MVDIKLGTLLRKPLVRVTPILRGSYRSCCPSVYNPGPRLILQTCPERKLKPAPAEPG